MVHTLLESLSMNNHHPTTQLSMDSSAPSHEELNIDRPPDINIPLSSDPSENLDVGPVPQIHENGRYLNLPKPGSKFAKRVDSIWGAWFFFNFYFRPVLHDKSKAKLIRDVNGVSGFDKSDLQLETFIVQHDMENMYVWVFKERPWNALGKMQLRSYMNGHTRQGDRPFPFNPEKGFVRSHKMQRKQYRGLSNPQCVHGIVLVPSPDLSCLEEEDRKRWIKLTGRELNFTVLPEASGFSSWRNLVSSDFELDRPLVKVLNGCDAVDPSSNCSKRKKNGLHHGSDDVMEAHAAHPHEPHYWLDEFSGAMRNAHGPVTAAKSIYEDEEGFLIVISLPCVDLQRVRVSWRNNPTRGVIKVTCVSTSGVSLIKRHGRTFKLNDPSMEHCPPGEFIREIALSTRIPEDANIEAFYDSSGTVLEIMAPKLRSGMEEHEVRVSLRPTLEPPSLS